MCALLSVRGAIDPREGPKGGLAKKAIEAAAWESPGRINGGTAGDTVYKIVDVVG
ncbi:MAG: hypothetical protein QOI43_3118, partial [Gaiellales bacterium]|nr:hypothetical protein [Gaiellales bacterium]